MDTKQGKLVIEVNLIQQIDTVGVITEALQSVKDALGEDRTDMFRRFAANKNFDLTDRDQLGVAASDFAKEYVSILP